MTGYQKYMLWISAIMKLLKDVGLACGSKPFFDQIQKPGLMNKLYTFEKGFRQWHELFVFVTGKIVKKTFL